MEPRTAYRIHVAAVLAALGSCATAAGFQSGALLMIGGASLLVAGVTAWRGERSLLAPRQTGKVLDSMAEGSAARAEVERANGLMMGILLTLLGAATLAFGLWLAGK